MTTLIPLPPTSAGIVMQGLGSADEGVEGIIRMADSESTADMLHVVGSMGWSLTTGPCALDYALKQISEEMASEPEEDKPTPFALETASRLLKSAQQLSCNAVAPNSIEGFEGDLILHWELGDRGAALVFPAWANKPVRLYREVLAEGIPVNTALQDDPTGMDVASLMAWLQNLQ